MYKIFKAAIHLFFCLCIVSTGKPLLELDNTKSHLDKYAHINKIHHDNIDDTALEHGHSHRHSEDGEEHEHNHDHSKIPQFELKFLNQSTNIQTNSDQYRPSQGFFEKYLISSPHLLKLFKPPIG
ncbi:hypothetical protein [Halobacteriovorax sp. JY17]|uniref:hypothetical protein n=1 Tax=Halobacteriovorax sp. JY17 TaxID=2014617 RepID=UPI000C58893E|nr:hypothetical protein [Halobacteriovorax sp. JY17]PIK14101.1 MAG: hypothetical protein CES88_14050 [Halobacteriovorax sp. JY17]